MNRYNRVKTYFSKPQNIILLLFGIVGMMKAKPDITDEELATLIAQTLRLDMTVMDPPPWREHPDVPRRTLGTYRGLHFSRLRYVKCSVRTSPIKGQSTPSSV